jgi:hypothetical protein
MLLRTTHRKKAAKLAEGEAAVGEAAATETESETAPDETKSE